MKKAIKKEDMPPEKCPRCGNDSEFLKEIKGLDDFQYITQWQYLCSNCGCVFSIEKERKDKPPYEIVR